MIPTGKDSLNTRSTMEVGGRSYAYYSLEKASAKLGDVSRLPYSMKVLLENLLRFEDGETVTRDDLQAMADWLKERRINREIQYRPARVLMQDFTGVPAVVDLAAMRDAMRALGGDPRKINPLVPLIFLLDIGKERGRSAECIDRHRVVDDEVDRNERINLARIAAERAHGIAHCGEIDHGWNTGEILHQHAGGAEGDLALALARL